MKNKMTKVHCDITTCEYWKKNGVNPGEGLCGCDEIELRDEQCITFGAHTDMSPEYREAFWKRMRSRADGHECKKETTGKRYDMAGFVWFTEQDDRWGTNEIWFTEQKSGLRVQGKDISEEKAEKIKGKINRILPVELLPDATFDDL